MSDLARRIALELGLASPSAFQEEAIDRMVAAEVGPRVALEMAALRPSRLLGIAQALRELVLDYYDWFDVSEQEQLDEWRKEW